MDEKSHKQIESWHARCNFQFSPQRITGVQDLETVFYLLKRRLSRMIFPAFSMFFACSLVKTTTSGEGFESRASFLLRHKAKTQFTNEHNEKM